ncbi:Os03g0581200, partial [Oryza sativa Japonica Group]
YLVLSQSAVHWKSLRGEQHATDNNPVGLGFSTSKLTTIVRIHRRC